jgi:hypothetical protein
MSNLIPENAEVWSAIFYLNLPTEEALPTTLEDWPQAKYIIYKSYQSNRAGYGENLMGYVQFKTKVSGVQLREINPNLVWKFQSSSNYNCIKYIQTRFQEFTVRLVVELGNHWPFKSGIAPSSTVPSTIQEYSLLKRKIDEEPVPESKA